MFVNRKYEKSHCVNNLFTNRKAAALFRVQPLLGIRERSVGAVRFLSDFEPDLHDEAVRKYF